MVRVITERDRRTKEFDFTTLPVSRDLQESFARAFNVRTGPGGTIKTMSSTLGLWFCVRTFTRFLSTLADPPRRVPDLRASHLDGYLLFRASVVSAPEELGGVIGLLAELDEISPQLAARCVRGRRVRRRYVRSTDSYTPEEDRRILDAARNTVREAAERIRGNRELLRRWRSGDPELVSDPMREEFLQLLDGVDRTGEVPAYDNGKVPDWVNHHGPLENVRLCVHLGWRDVAALLVLLVRMTGQNGGTIATAPAVYHSTDGGAGPIASVQVDLVKPRRGQRSHMTASFAELPTWAALPHPDVEFTARDQLHTPYGVYMLVIELTASARAITGDDRLFLYWARRRGAISTGMPVGQNFVSDWGREQQLLTDPDADGAAHPLPVHLARIRKTHVEREQKPVAHTPRTLADTYLRRDRTTIAEYQQVVADVLVKEADKARALGSIARLTPNDLLEARDDPSAVADRFGITVDVLRLLIRRDADTVLAGCADNLNSPHTPKGRPCTASFLKCLDCPCARAMPHHLPIQLAALDLLQQKRTQMAAARWAIQLAYPTAQLEDLVDLYGSAAVATARTKITDDERSLVVRLFDRELDQP